MLWLSYFSCTAGLYMQLWLSYFPPISENLVIRNVHSEEKRKIHAKKHANLGCIHLSLFVIWYSYLDNLIFFSRSKWKRRLNKKRMEETERSDRFSKDDTEKFNEAWRHRGVITEMVQKTCIFGFQCKKYNSPMYFVFDLCHIYTTQHVVYISQPCRLYNSAIPQTYPKIGNLNSSTLKKYIEDHLTNIKWI